jgi:hypothetical protein
VLAALLILVASPRGLYIFMSATSHNTVVYPCTALLGAYLIWLTRGDGRRRATVYAVPLLAGVALGACIASDALLVVTGVVPLACTAVLAAARRGRRSRSVAVSALTTAVVAIPIAKLTSTTMGSLGYVTLAPSPETAPLSALPRHAELMWEGLQGLFNGYLSQTASSGLETGLGVACAIIMIAALITLLVVGVRTTAKFIWSGLRNHEQPTPAGLATALHTIYWARSAVITCVAFALSIRLNISMNRTMRRSCSRWPRSSRRSYVGVTARWLVSAGASICFREASSG